MTMTQQILAQAAGVDSVAQGDIIMAKADVCLANDITAPLAISQIEKSGLAVKYPSRAVLALDHFTPAKDIASASQCAAVRAFAKKWGIEKLYDGGNCGVEHVLLPEQGLVGAGNVVIGADSHTCTYGAVGAFATGVGSTDFAFALAEGKVWLKTPPAIEFHLKGALRSGVCGKDVILKILADIGVRGALYSSMEFTGDVGALSMDDRFTICNMAVEAGAKNAIFESDSVTKSYLTYTGAQSGFFPAPDGGYAKTVEIDLEKIEPMVAYPHLPSNGRRAADAEKENIAIDQAVIGSCTNGRLGDMAAAASVLQGVKVSVRTIIIPATAKVYADALDAGYIKTFLDAGCIVAPPTCGPCLGGHMGVLAKGERCVSTTNRNFVGRMGDAGSFVYLASPYTAAASAVKGYIGGAFT